MGNQKQKQEKADLEIRMNRNKGKTKTKSKKTEEDDAVEELLQAAQDDMLLGLSVDSHISHLSDVERRFQALKLKSPPPQLASKPKSSGVPAVSSVQVDQELKAVLGDDLSTRFAALKASLPTPSSSSSIIAAGSTLHHDSDSDSDSVDEDDEVEKLMRWAKDAARLDPSPPSDDEE